MTPALLALRAIPCDVTDRACLASRVTEIWYTAFAPGGPGFAVLFAACVVLAYLAIRDTFP